MKFEVRRYRDNAMPVVINRKENLVIIKKELSETSLLLKYSLL